MNANDLMLFAGLGVILFIVLMGVIGFCVGGKREFVWITILLLLLGIVWIGFGNVDKILNANLNTYSETINQLVSTGYNFNTLWEFILEYAKGAISNADILFVEGSNAYQALYDIVSCVLRAALLIVGTLSVIILILVARFITLLVRLIVGLILLIVRACNGKRRQKEEKTIVKQPVIEKNVTVTHDNNENSSNAIVTVEKQPTTQKRKPKLRWWGAGVGVAKAFLILMLIFVPISGVVTIASSVSSDSLKAVNEFMNGSSETKEVADTNSAIDQVYEYIYAYQDSFIGKFMDFSSFFFKDDLSNMIFEDLLTVKLDGQEIVLPKEIVLYIEVVNKLAPVYENGKVNLYNYAMEHPEEMDEAFNLLKQSKLVPAILPIGIEYASTMDSLRELLENSGFTKEEIDDVFKTFVEINWYEDWELVCDILRDGIIIGDFFAEEINILEFNSEPLRRVLTKLGTTSVVNEIMPVAIKFALNMEQIKNFVGEDVEVNLEGINWATELSNFANMYDCFVKLGIGLNDFSNLNLEYLQTLLKDEEKCDAVIELLGYLVGAPNGEIDENINLFAQVILPIVDVVVNKQLVDNSLEMFADIISLTGKQYAESADFDVKKMWQHDLQAIVKIAQLASNINLLSLKVEEMKLDDVESLKGIIDELFDLQLLGGSVEYKGRFEQLKTALLEAAIDKFAFLLPDSDWSKVDWNVEKENIKGLIDVFGEILKLNDELKAENNLEEDIINLATFKIDWQTLLQDEKGRFIDLVIKGVEVFFDDETPSELFLTAIPNAVNKYLIPKLDEVDSELGDLPLFDGLTSDEIREEVLNFIEIFKDVAALKITTENPEYSAKVGENKDTYALSDILQRIIKSKLLVYTDGETPQDYRGRIIRIVLKLATNIEIDTHDLDGTLIGGPIDYDGDLNKIDALVTSIIEEVIEDDGALNAVLFNEGKLEFNMDKFLEFVLDDNKVNGVINALEAIFGKYNPENPELNSTPATLLSALLPGVYYAYLEGAIPTEFKPILDIKHFAKNENGIFTGVDLANDISKLLYALHKAVDLGALEIYNNGNFTESEYEITDETIKGISAILEVLPEIKIFQEKFADVIDITLGLINVNISSEAYTKIENAHLYEFVNAFTNEENGVLAKIHGILEETDYIKVSDIFALIKSDNLMGEVEDKFINKKVINYGIDAIEQLVNIELVGILLPDLLEQMVYPMLPGNINPVLDALYITSYEPTEIISDLITIIEAVRIIINDTDLISYFYDGTFHVDEIAIENLDDIAPAFEKLSELNILKTANAAIIEFINSLNIEGFELYSTIITEEKLRHDFKEVLGNKDGIFKFALDALYTLDIVRVGDLNTLSSNSIQYSENLAEAVIGVLDEIAKLETLNAILPNLVIYGATILDKMGYEFKVLRQIPNENLDGELARIVNVVKAIYETGAVTEYFEFESVHLSQEKINTVIDAVFELRFYKGLCGEFFADALNIAVKVLNLDINLDNIDTENIHWYSDAELLKASVRPILELLKNIGYDNYPTIMEFINAIKADPMALITRENALYIIDVLDNIVQLESLSRLLPEGIRFAIATYLPNYGIEFLANIKPEEISSDLTEVMHILRDVVELGAIEFYNNGKFDGDIEIVTNKAKVTEIFDHLAKLNIIENNSAEILSFALNYLSKMLNTNEEFTAVEFSDYSISEEIKTIKMMVGLLVDLLDSADLGSLNKITSFDFKNYKELITDKNIKLIADVVDYLPKLETFYHLLPFGARYVSTFMDILKPLEGKSPEQLQEDLVSITEIIRMIADYGIAEAVLTTLDGKLYDFDTTIITLVRAVLEKVLFLNVLDQSESNYLKSALEMFGINDTNIYYPNINWTDDKNAILSILDVVKEVLDDLEIKNLSDVTSIINNNQIMDKFVNNTVLKGVQEVLDNLVNLTVLKELLFPVYDKFVLPILANLPTELVDINTIYNGNSGLFIDDLNAIVDILSYAIDLDVIGIYNGETIDYANPAIGNIISTLFGINYLNIEGQLESIVNYVLDVIHMDIEIENINTINLANDGEALAAIYNEHFVPFLSDEEFMFKSINDFQNIKLTDNEINKLISLLAKNNNGASLVEGLQKMVELDLGKVAIVAGVAFVLDTITIDNPVYEALDIASLTGEQLISDVIDILNVVLIVVKDFKAIDVIANGIKTFVLPENAEELVHKMGSLIFNLNILSEPTSDIIKAALDTYLPALDTSSVNFENVTIASLEETIKEVIVLTFGLLDKLNINDYNSAMEYYNNYIESLSVIYENDAVNGVLAIVDTLLDNTLVKELLYAAYISFAPEFVSPYGIDVNSYANNSSSIDEAKALLLTDVLTVVETIKLAYNFAFGKTITFNDVPTVSQIIENLFGLHILNDNLSGLINYLNKTVGLTIDASKLDLAYDADMIKRFYETIEPILTDDNWMFKSYTDVLDFLTTPQIETSKVEALITNENAELIIDALHTLVDTTLVGATLEGVNQKIKDLVPSEFNDFLNAINLDDYLKYNTETRTRSSLVVEDLHSILEILTQVVKFGVIDYYKNQDLTLISGEITNQIPLLDIVYILFNLNLLNYDSEAIIKATLKLAYIDIPVNADYNYFDGVKFINEIAPVQNVISNIYDIIRELFGDDVKVSTIYYFVVNQEYIVDNTFDLSLITTGLVEAIVRLFDTLNTSRILTDAIIPVYNKFIYSGLDSSIKDLASLEKYNPSILREDIASIADILFNICDENVIEYFQEFMNADHSVEIDYSSRVIADTIEAILTLNIVSVKEADILNAIYSSLGFMMPYTADEIADMLDLATDSRSIADFVYALQTGFFTEGFYKYPSDYRTFNSNDFLYQALKQEVAIDLVEAFEIIKDTSLIDIIYRSSVDAMSDLLVKFVDEEFKDLMRASNLSDEKVVEDYLTIVNIIKYAIENYGAQNLCEHAFFHTGDIQIYKVIDIIQNVLEKVISMNMLNNSSTSLSRMIEVVMNKFLKTTFNNTLADVNYVSEVEIINETLDIIVEMLKETIGENITYNNFVNWFNEANYIDNVVYENVLEAVNKLLTLKTIEKVVLPVYEKFEGSIKETLGEYGYLAELRYTTGTELVTEVRTIISALKDLVEIDPVGIYLDYANVTSNTKINYAHTSIKNLIETLLKTKYLETHEADIISTLFTMLEKANIEISYTKEEIVDMLDLAADANTIATVVTDIFKAYFVDGFYQYGSSYRDIVVADFAEQIKNDEIITNIITALEKAKDTTIVNISYRVIVNYVASFLANRVDPEFTDLINTRDLINDTLVSEDYITILNIVNKVVTTYGINNIFDHINNLRNVDVYKTTDIIKYTLEEVVTLNVIEFTLPRIIEVIMNKYLRTILYGQLEGINYESEVAIINEAIDLVVDALKETLENDNVTVDTLINWINNSGYVDNKVIENVLTAIEKVLDLDTVEKTILEVYEIHQLRVEMELTAINHNLIGFAELRYTNGAELISDIKPVIDAIKQLVDIDLAGMYLDYVNNSKTVKIDYTNDLFVNVIETVLTRKYVENHKHEISNIIYKVFDRNIKDYTIEDIENTIDLAADAHILAVTITNVLDTVVGDDYLYTSDYKEFITDDVKAKLLSDEGINELITVIKDSQFANTTLAEICYHIAVEFVRSDIISEVLGTRFEKYFLTSDLTSEQVKADLNTMFDLIIEMTNNDIIKYLLAHFDLSQIENVKAANIIAKALTTVAKLNLTKDNLGDFISEYLSAAEVAYDIDLTDINLASELTIIANTLKDVANELNEKDIIYVTDIMNASKSSLIPAAVVAVEGIIDLTILDKLAMPGITYLRNKFINNKDSFIGQMTDVEFYNELTDVTLMSEIRLVVKKAISVYKNKLVNYLEAFNRETKLDYVLLLDAFSDIYDTIATTAYINNKETIIVRKAMEVINLDQSLLSVEEMTTRLDLSKDTTVVRNGLMYVAENILSDSKFSYTTINEWTQFNLRNTIIFLTENGMFDHTINAMKEFIGTTEASTISEVAYMICLAYAKQRLNNSYSSYTYVIEYADLTNAEIKSDLDMIMNILETISASELNTNVEAVLRSEFNYRTLNASDLFPVFEVVLKAVLGTETTPNLNALADDLSSIITKLVNKVLNINVDLTDVNMKHETLIVIDLVEDIINLGIANGLSTVGDYLDSINDYKSYITDENVYELAAIINKALELETIEKHGIELYTEVVYNKVLANTSIAKIADLANIYADNTELINDARILLAVLKDLTNKAELTTGLISYARDLYLNVNRYELTLEFINALTPAIVESLTTIIAQRFAEIALNKVETRVGLYSDITLDINSDATDLTDLIETLIDIVIGNMTYINDVRDLTSRKLGGMMISDHNMTRIADAIDTAAETTVVRIGYDLLVEYADRKSNTFASGRLSNVINTNLATDEITEDIKTLTAILRTLDAANVESDLRALVNNNISVADINVVKYQPSISTILDKVAQLHVIGNMSEIVINVLNYVKVINVTDEVRNTLATINYRDEFVVLSDAASVFITNMAIALGDATTLTLRQVLNYVRSYRSFADSYTTFENVANTVIDTLEVLKDSQIVKGIAISAYNKLIANNASLPVTLRDILSLDASYTADNFMNDYTKVLNIVRSIIDAKMYKVVYNRHLTEFEVLDNLDEELANIINTIASLDFLTINNNNKVVQVIGIVANRIGYVSSLDQVKDQFATIDLLAEGRIFAGMTTDMVNAFKVMQNYGRNIDLPLFGETELVQSIVNIYDAYLTSETHTIVTPVLVNALVTPKVYTLTQLLGHPQEVFASDLTNDQVYELCIDAKAILELLLEVGVFANGTINLTDATGNATNEKLVKVYEIIMSHITLSSTIERVLNAIVRRAYIAGSIDIDYSVMSLANEKSVLLGLISQAKELALDVINSARARDFGTIVSVDMENRVNALYNDAMNSEILHQFTLPIINIIFAGALGDQYAFLLFDENDGVTIDNIMDEVHALFAAGREIETVVNFSDGSLGFEFTNFENINIAIDLLINMKCVNGGTTDNLENIVRFVSEKLLKVTLSDNVVVIDEVEILKAIIASVNPLIETGAYENKSINSAILSKDALNIIANILEEIHDSVILYELKDRLIDIVSRFIPASVREKTINFIKNTSVETLKADTLILAETLRIAANANIHQNGALTITTKEQFYTLADAYEKVFTMNSISIRVDKLYEEVFNRIDLSNIAGNINLIANVNNAIANEGWSWQAETAAIADLIRALGDLAEGGVEVLDGVTIKLNNIMECTDQTLLANLIKAINNISSIRPIFISIIKDLNLTIGSLNVTEFYSEWLNNQLADNATMASKAEWNTEIDTLVKIYIDSKELNSDLSSMTEEDVDSLVALLKDINHSRLFNINALTETSLINDALSNMVSSGTQIKLADTSAWSIVTWDTEIDNLGGLLKEAIRLGATSSSFIISSLTETDITSLLTKLNKSELVRTMIPTIIMDSLRDNDAEDLASDWLRTEYNNVTDDNSETVMSSVEEWNNEIPNLAKIVTRVNKIDFVTEDNRADLETVLRAINHSRLFSIDAINTRLTSDSIMSKLGFAGKTLGTVTYVTVPGDAQQTQTNKMNAWDTEISALLALIDLARKLNILDGSTNIESTIQSLNTAAAIEEVLDTMNNSSLFRVLVPEMIVSTATTLGAENYVSTWLRNEKTTMSDKSVWDTENTKLAAVIGIINASDIDFGSFNNGITIEDTKLYTIKNILLAIDESSSFTIDPIVNVMNTSINNIDGVRSANITLNANNVTNWETELDVLFGEFDANGTMTKKGVYSMASELTEISESSLDAVATILDKMIESSILYPVLDQIFDASIKNTALYESEETDVLTISYNPITVRNVNARIKDELTSIIDQTARWSWTKEIMYMQQIKTSIDNFNANPTLLGITTVATTINDTLNTVKVSDGNGGYKPALIVDVADSLLQQVREYALNNYGIDIDTYL